MQKIEVLPNACLRVRLYRNTRLWVRLHRNTRLCFTLCRMAFLLGPLPHCFIVCQNALQYMNVRKIVPHDMYVNQTLLVLPRFSCQTYIGRESRPIYKLNRAWCEIPLSARNNSYFFPLLTTDWNLETLTAQGRQKNQLLLQLITSTWVSVFTRTNTQSKKSYDFGVQCSWCRFFFKLTKPIKRIKLYMLLPERK